MKNDWITKKPYFPHLIWALWAFFYAMAFPTYNISFLIWFVFAPVFAFSYQKSIADAARYGFFYSFFFLGLAFFWLYGFWAPAVFLVIPIYAVYYGFFFMLTALVGKQFPKLRWLIVPMLWVSMEYFRGIGFHGFLWNMIGDTQWAHPLLIQSADIFGVWGVSFLILLGNAVIAELILVNLEKPSVRSNLEKQNMIRVCVFLGIFLLNLIYGAVRIHQFEKIEALAPKEKLALIQPNIGPHDAWFEKLWEHYDVIWKLSTEAASKGPDMIVWSETMVRNLVWGPLKTYPPDVEVNKFNLRCLSIAKETGIPVLFTCPDQIGKTNYNAAFYLDPATAYLLPYTNEYGIQTWIKNPATVQSNSKIHLVPFGEWMPVYDELPIVKDIMKIEGAGAFRPSENKEVIHTRKGAFRVLVCYEDIYAELARQFIPKGLNYFVNVTDDAWAYKQGFSHPMWQHLAGATLTAVSVRRPIARAVNSGVTGIIHSEGSFEGDIGDYVPGFYVGDMPLVPENVVSFYSKWGHVFPFVLLLISAAAVIFSVVCGLKENKRSMGENV